eukprot:15810011-Heterocapsa_arctica.AAC.1
MDGTEGNKYTTAGRGTSTEHSIDVPATILESILGLGAIFGEHGFAELEDMPELVVEIEEGLKTHRNQFGHCSRR